MAKRNYRKSSKKIQPAVMKLHFRFQQDGAKNSNYIDLSQVASLVNRRFYRQGLNWAVSGFKMLTQSDVTGEVSINKLPNTWVMSNAWEKSFRAWNKMIKHAVDETDQQSVKGKFLDFKVYANADHHKFGFGNNLLPHSSATLSNSIQVAEPGEWLSATFEVPVTRNVTALPYETGETITYEVIAVGGNYPGVSVASGRDAISMINGYENSRALPSVTDPNTPADSGDADGVTPENWMAALFNDGVTQDSDVIESITEYDQPPYPYEGDGNNSDTQYPGGQNNLSSLEIHQQEFITTTTVGGTTRFQGGNFPCGLIEIQSKLTDKAEIIFEVSLVPGTHRGYLAEPMTEM